MTSLPVTLARRRIAGTTASSVGTYGTSRGAGGRWTRRRRGSAGSVVPGDSVATSVRIGTHLGRYRARGAAKLKGPNPTLLHPYRFRVHEFPDADRRQFAAVAAFLDAA